MGCVKNILIAHDQLINAFCGGWPDETISSRSWRWDIFDGRRWCGLDPTNDCMIDSGYICLTTGRDYNDCILDKGFFRTPGDAPCTVSQKQDVTVTVRDM